VVTTLIIQRRSSVFALCPLLGPPTAVFAKINTIYSVVRSSWTFQILEKKTVCVSISESWTESIAQSGTVVPSEILYTEPDESSWHPTLDSSKLSSNIIPLIRDNIILLDFQTILLLILLIFPKSLTSSTNIIFLNLIGIFSSLLLTSPCYYQISSSASYSYIPVYNWNGMYNINYN